MKTFYLGRNDGLIVNGETLVPTDGGEYSRQTVHEHDLVLVILTHEPPTRNERPTVLGWGMFLVAPWGLIETLHSLDQPPPLPIDPYPELDFDLDPEDDKPPPTPENSGAGGTVLPNDDTPKGLGLD